MRLSSVIFASFIASWAMATDYGVVIGVAEYAHVNDLNSPDNDARSIYNAITCYSNWNPSNIDTLINSQGTKSAIQSAINTMETSASSSDRCLFYFAGHGNRASSDYSPYDEPDGRDEFIVPQDAYSWDYDTQISDDELTDWFADIPCDLVIILDACFCGGALDGETKDIKVRSFGNVSGTDGIAEEIIKARKERYEKDPNQNPNTLILTACRYDQTSMESGNHGIFTFYYAGGIYEHSDSANANHDDTLSFEEVFYYAKPLVEAFGQGVGQDQNPQIWDGVSGEFPINEGGFPPIIAMITPHDNETVPESPCPVQGTIDDPSVTYVTIITTIEGAVVDSQDVVVEDYVFATTVPLEMDKTALIKITATNEYGIGKLFLHVTFGEPGQEELYYDNGVEKSVITQGSGRKAATRFSPDGFPIRIKKVKFYLSYDASSYPFRFIICPGTGDPLDDPLESQVLIDSSNVDVSGAENGDWFEIDVSKDSLILTENEFFVILYYNSTGPKLTFADYRDGLVGHDDSLRAYYYGHPEYPNDWVVFNDGSYMTRTIIVHTQTGVEENLNYQLSTINYRLSVRPNPFTTVVSVQWLGISNEGSGTPITLKIYDLSGRLVKTLTPNPSSLTPAVSWDGTDNSGKRVKSGVYFVRLECPDLSGPLHTKRVILVR